jgi:Leu/Phe-tRNA-protein transferase
MLVLCLMDRLSVVYISRAYYQGIVPLTRQGSPLTALSTAGRTAILKEIDRAFHGVLQ